MRSWFFVATICCSVLGRFASDSAAAAASLLPLEGPAFVLSLQYDTENNFLKKNVYREFGLHQCFVHPDLKSKLEELAANLAKNGYKLVLWDCYRPPAVQQAMWKLVPDSRFVANPKVGSNHNRGIAVDATLAKEDGNLLEMPTAFDDFTAKASPGYRCKADEKTRCENRDLLVHWMGEVGLKPLNSEWWHYQLPDAKRYPIVESLDAQTH